MKFENLRNRLMGGYYFEKLKAIKKYTRKDDKIMQDYLRYMKYIYWHGASHYNGNAFSTENDSIEIYDIRIPNFSGNSVNAFWGEFPDVLLPYMIEMQGKKYGFSDIRNMMREGPYEYNAKTSVEEDDVVIDCGANIGLFSAIAASKGATVYAFEPDKTIIESYLRKTAEYNKGIIICEYALSDHEGLGNFVSDAVNIGGGSIGNLNGVINGMKVELTTIDSFVERNDISSVDFIKADIEGAEREMLRGATRTLKEFGPKLSICTYHLPDDKQVIEKIILSANSRYIIKHDYAKVYAWME